eukprot:TRINITY_DN3601_c0_g1_i2.p1 TRINITY_DN3601_c0_g1~~TRINITY_DN3601_c0_g1_i2.p1  ORF type:complete len:287 (-),score=58.33 TRINITY_DN3601_c0_g1_i2:9-869(-)
MTTTNIKVPKQAVVPQHFEKTTIEDIRQNVQSKKGYILDMDGVIYHGDHMLPGVDKFLGWLMNSGKKFIFLTNSSERTPEQLSAKIHRLTGHTFSPKLFHTCALSTARFISGQMSSARVFVIGGDGLRTALVDDGHVIVEEGDADFVAVGETPNYDFNRIIQAAEIVRRGAKLIGTNKDIRDRMGEGFIPSTGALVTPIELTCNQKAYFIGKPNPLIMSHALKKFEGLSRSDVAIIGDNMDTDIVGGIEAEIETVLLLSGVTAKEDLHRYAYRPTYVVKGLGDLVD